MADELSLARYGMRLILAPHLRKHGGVFPGPPKVPVLMISHVPGEMAGIDRQRMGLSAGKQGF
jgi:hypothetical protein